MFEERPPAYRMAGVVLGQVTANKDPDQLGRVKVRLSGWDEEVWARVASFAAGDEWGAFFLPEVEDEVLLAFAEGDISNPFVIGVLYNGKAKPAYPQDGKNFVKSLRTKGGNEIFFNDEAGKEKVEIKTKEGFSLILDQGENGLLQLSTKGGHSILLDDKKKVAEIKTSGGLKITMDDNKKSLGITDGSNKIVMESAGITIQSSSKLTLKSTQVEIQGDAQLTVKSSGILTLQGALVKIN